MSAEPFLKWVGGKGRLLPQLQPFLPPMITGRYWEPFLGGGAMYFKLTPNDAVLSDSNEELIRTYRVVCWHPRDVINAFRVLASDWTPDSFSRVVTMRPGLLSDFDVAGRMLFLNRSAFNGLYRVNRSGQFNAPWGKYLKPTTQQILDLTLRLDAASNAMFTRADLRTGDFQTVLQGAEKGDFVYLDPPYVPLSKTACFDSYGPGGFGINDLVRLRETCDKLTKCGTMWMLSNSDTVVVRELFTKPENNIQVVTAPRAVAAKGSSRKSVKELVIRNYKGAKPIPRKERR